MKVLFYVDTGGATGGPGMHSVMIHRAFGKHYPESTGPLAFAADPRDEEIFARALGRDAILPLDTRTVEDPAANPTVPRADFYVKLCDAARKAGCDRIHVLWGFLQWSQIEPVPEDQRIPVSMTLCEATARSEDPEIDAVYFGDERRERYLRDALTVRCRYLAISERTRRAALAKQAEDISTLHLWVSPELTAQRTDVAADYVLYVGAIADYKGVSHILDYARAYPEQPIVVCGTESPEFPVDFRRYPSIDYRGYLPYAEVLSLMARARALLYPSYAQGFGLPMIEAQAIGAPLIVNPRNRLVAELLSRGSYVSVGNVGSPSAIQIAIDVAVRDRDALRVAGFRNAERFEEARQIAQLHDAIASHKKTP